MLLAAPSQPGTRGQSAANDGTDVIGRYVETGWVRLDIGSSFLNFGIIGLGGDKMPLVELPNNGSEEARK